MKELKEGLSTTNVYIFILVVIFFLALLVIWVEKNTEARALNNIEIDETTGCEYYIFRNILTPRVDETGKKVRGCKNNQ